MTLSTTARLVDEARRRGAAVGAFNVITLEHAEAIVAGAVDAGCGVVLQVSQNAARFHGGDPRPVVAACRALAEACPDCEFRPLLFRRPQYEAELARVSEEYRRTRCCT